MGAAVVGLVVAAEAMAGAAESEAAAAAGLRAQTVTNATSRGTGHVTAQMRQRVAAGVAADGAVAVKGVAGMVAAAAAAMAAEEGARMAAAVVMAVSISSCSVTLT